MRVLISAYACEPDAGSEPGVGWHWVREVARFAEVWAITRRNNRARIEAALSRSPMPNVHFVYHDLPGWARGWKHGPGGVQAYYILWQRGARRIAERLVRSVGIDVVHHATFANYWLPALAGLAPAPFVWGPVGGGDGVPQQLRPGGIADWLGREGVRRAVRALGSSLPATRRIACRAAVGLAATPNTAERMRRLGCRDVRVLSQVALGEEDLSRLSAVPIAAEPGLRLVSVGRLVALKGHDLALRAVAACRREGLDVHYTLVGDGPRRKFLVRLSAELGVADRVRFVGALPRPEVFAALARSNAMIHPSRYESGGWACAEGMAAGLPVVCLDSGGPALVVDAGSGFKVPVGSEAQVVAGLAGAVAALARDPGRRRTLAEGARRRIAESFTWRRRGREIRGVFEDAVEAAR